MTDARPAEKREATERGATQRAAARPGAAHHEEHPEGGHGHSVAAWTAVGVILLGSAVMAVAVVAALVWLFFVGAVVVVVGAVLGKVLSAMGFGPNVTLDSAAEDAGPGRDRAPDGVR
jgi:hypothetical protein